MSEINHDDINLATKNNDELNYDNNYGEDCEIGLNNDENMKPLDYAKLISLVDDGAYMKIKFGTAGKNPDEDQFSSFAFSKKLFCTLFWEGYPSEWRILFFNKPNEINDFNNQITDTDEGNDYFEVLKNILVSDIEEVFLEPSPSDSFRIYISESTSSKFISENLKSNQNEMKKVLRLTPIPAARNHASSWVDTIFSAMMLQNIESEAMIQNDDQDQSNNQYSIGFLENLRFNFYESLEIHHDEDEFDNNKSQLVSAAEDTDDLELGGNSIPEHRLSYSSHATTKSAFVDLSMIYGNKRRDNEEGEEENNCCIIT